MSIGRLSSISSQTLTQVLERQRLQALGRSAPPSQFGQITRNLGLLREGIIQLEDANGGSDTPASTSLRNQWERARRMLGEDGNSIEDLPLLRQPTPDDVGTPMMSLSGTDPVNTPYTDDPPTPPSPAFEPHEEMQTQRQMMDEQDTHLDTLSSSIQRQREISMHIGSELDVHQGLLEDLEVGIDRTASNLGGARRRLDRVARGARENGSAVIIGGLIFVLLLLIVVFKT